MRKQIKFSTGIFAAAMMLLFSLQVLAQTKAVVAPAGTVSNVVTLTPPSTQKQITRAQFMAMEGSEQQVVLSNLDKYSISDLVNATPVDMTQRKANASYIAADNFTTMSKDQQWQVLKNPSANIVVQEASQIPKIRVTKEEYQSFTQERKLEVRNSSEYIIVD